MNKTLHYLLIDKTRQLDAPNRRLLIRSCRLLVCIRNSLTLFAVSINIHKCATADDACERFTAFICSLRVNTVRCFRLGTSGAFAKITAIDNSRF